MLLRRPRVTSLSARQRDGSPGKRDTPTNVANHLLSPLCLRYSHDFSCFLHAFLARPPCISGTRHGFGTELSLSTFDTLPTVIAEADSPTELEETEETVPLQQHGAEATAVEQPKSVI